MKTLVFITEGTRRKEKNGNRPCNSRGCKTCRHIKTTDTFQSTDTKRSRKSYKVHTAANCKTISISSTEVAIFMKQNLASLINISKRQCPQTTNEPNSKRCHLHSQVTVFPITSDEPIRFYSLNKV